MKNIIFLFALITIGFLVGYLNPFSLFSMWWYSYDLIIGGSTGWWIGWNWNKIYAKLILILGRK